MFAKASSGSSSTSSKSASPGLLDTETNWAGSFCGKITAVGLRTDGTTEVDQFKELDNITPVPNAPGFYLINSTSTFNAAETELAKAVQKGDLRVLESTILGGPQIAVYVALKLKGNKVVAYDKDMRSTGTDLGTTTGFSFIAEAGIQHGVFKRVSPDAVCCSQPVYIENPAQPSSNNNNNKQKNKKSKGKKE